MIPEDGLTLEQYNELVDSGTIKGYSGKVYASAAHKYADDFYVKYDDRTNKVKWCKIKDKASLLLETHLARSEAQKELTEQLADLQSRETALVRKVASLEKQTLVIRSVLHENVRQDEFRARDVEHRRRREQERIERENLQRELHRARADQTLGPFPWSQSQISQLHHVPRVLFVVDTNLWIDNSCRGCPTFAIVSRVLHVVRGHHGTSALLIPRAVNAELDGLKNAGGATGAAARSASRLIERNRCRFFDDPDPIIGQVRSSWHSHL